MTLQHKFRVLMVGIVTVPAVTALLLSAGVALFSRDSETITRFVEQRDWIEREIRPRIETEDFDDIVPPEGVMVVVIDHFERTVLFSSIPELTAGHRVDELDHPPEFDGPPQGNFTFFLENVENSAGRVFQIAQAFPAALQREFFGRTRRVMIALAGFLGMVLIGSVGGNIAIISFRRRLTSIREAIRRIAGGNLDVPVVVVGNDELSGLARDLDATRGTLKEEYAKRSRFLMSVSHDLKTPLTTIRGYLEAIDDGLADDEETLAQYLSIISQKSEVLETRIVELIEFVRMETGDWRMQNARFSLFEFLTRHCVVLTEDARVHGRTFNYNIDLPAGLYVTGDKELLTRVFENLFHNALRYTADGDRVTVSAGVDPDGAVVVFVEDTGPGFGDNDPEKLFEPLARGTNSRQEPGFGLGLSTARAIVDSHGWTIDARNAEGGGASFRIRIPKEQLATSGV